MPRKPAARHMVTPFCISQVAEVWRSVCGVTLPESLVNRTAVLSAVFTEATGAPFHSTKCSLMIPFACQRRMWARSRAGIGAGGCRFFVGRAPSARR
jgi:hypothetical protein